MPPYVIFHDATLRLIAASPPSTLDELRQVNGVGDTKLDKYGQAILDVSDVLTRMRTCPERARTLDSSPCRGRSPRSRRAVRATGGR